MSSAIELSQVFYRYPTGEANSWAIRDFSLQVPRGRMTLIQGQNGSGKTTILKILAGLIPEFHGGHFIGNRTVYLTKDESISTALHGSDHLYIHTNAYQELTFILEISTAHNIQKTIDDIIQRFGMDSYAHIDFDQLSAGQRQMVNLALSFAREPAVILLDEPLGHLDEKHVQIVKRNIHFAIRNWKSTIVIVDHNIEMWREFQPTVIELQDDRVKSTTNISIPTKKATTQNIVIEIKGLHFGFHNRKLFEDFNLNISSGECICVLGENAAGKSTLLRLLLELIKATKGMIHRNKDAHITMLARPTIHNFFSMKVAEEIKLSRKKNLDETLESMKDRYVFDLSQGELSKLALSIYFFQAEDILLLDEPFLYLDVGSKQKLIHDVIELRNRGVCILYTAHPDSNEDFFADRVIRI